jgi:hypothetical protein
VISYKTYRLLNDASVIDFLDISPRDVSEIVNNTTKIQGDEFSYHVASNGKILLVESIEPSGGFLFHTLDDILRMRKIFIKSSTMVTTFWPEPRTFENITGSEIDKLISALELDRDKLDYSIASLQYVERTLQEKNLTYNQQVLSLFLGILSYAGGCLIKHYGGKWHMEIEEENQYSSWEPKIALPSGKILDPFAGLFGGLLLRSDDGKLIPIFSLEYNARP